MEPGRGSRFVRGRGRGGGPYRPYFYFCRNGKTIPGNQIESNGNNANERRRRGRGGLANSARVTANNSGIPTPLETSLLRSTRFAAPSETVFQTVQSVAVEEVPECIGWRLYFPKESYDPSSHVAKRIKVLESYYSACSRDYDLLKIHKNGFFNLDFKAITENKDIKEIWPNFENDLQFEPYRTLSILGLAMYSVLKMAQIDTSLISQPCRKDTYVPRFLHPKKIYVRLIGLEYDEGFSEISNENLDKLVSVRGCVIATSGTEINARWVCYRCSRCNQEQSMKSQGNYISRPYACKRTDCHAKRDFVELRTSPYTRLQPLQTIRLVEETLEDIDVEQRQKLDIELRHELVDSCAPGQHVIITGVLKKRALAESENISLESRQKAWPASNSNTIQIYLKAVSITHSTYIPYNFTDRDMNAITAISEEPDSFKLLVNSFAPEICGQELVKAGLLISLFGSAGSQVHKNSEINVLLVGDPGAGKSHLLQMCANISEKGTFLNAKRGASSNNINISVQGRAQNLLNFGAFITSLNGHIAVDDIDRIASQQELLLQIIQSQKLSTPCPGTFLTQSMHSSVIASANSSRGHYDNSKLLSENIRILPALINQFHLIFILSDKPNKDHDMTFTEHIKKLHAGAKKSTTIASRYIVKPRSNNSFSTTSIIEANDVTENENYILSERLKLAPGEESNMDLLPAILIKKYIVYARQQLKPLLSDAAIEAIKSFYAEMCQQKSDDKSMDVNTSQLMGLIQLSQARARVDLCPEVSYAHVRDVICIVRYCMEDMQIGDFVDLDRASSRTGKSASIKKFLKVLQLRANALSRRTFELDELKEMARHVGIFSDISNVIDAVNLQGFLLKKGSNIYEVIDA